MLTASWPTARGSSRWRNLGELANLASERRVSELDEFLDQIALVSDVDALDGQGRRPREAGVVQLSTIHGAKGLEFDHVFVTGVEEGLLPHYYCSDSEEEIEQERRLLYVAMTRAKQKLFLTHTSVRGRWGKVSPVDRSRFLDELPSELSEEITQGYQRRRFGGGRRFGGAATTYAGKRRSPSSPSTTSTSQPRGRTGLSRPRPGTEWADVVTPYDEDDV